MNYRKTAAILNITQPTVTQHIQALEKEYGCELFNYSNHKLTQTQQAKIIENHLRKMKYDDEWMRAEIKNSSIPSFRIGATKSIGHYMISDKIAKLISGGKYHVSLLVDNTTTLLNQLSKGQLDVAMIEGEFDKSLFGSSLMQNEEFVGICRKDSPLAGREVDFEEIKGELLILREEGSGTRSIFENQLHIHGESINSFASTASISSFAVIKNIIAKNGGITFAYKSVLCGDPELATFTLKDYPTVHPLHYVYLPTSHAKDMVNELINL